MDKMERILQFHEQNLQIYVLLESAVTCLENKLFEGIINFPRLAGRMPTQLMLTLCMPHHIIEVTIGNLQYNVEIKAIMHRLKPYSSVGIDEMADAILDELEDKVRDYFSWGA